MQCHEDEFKWDFWAIKILFYAAKQFLSKIFLLTNSFLIILVMLPPDHFCSHITIMKTGLNISVKVSYIPTRSSVSSSGCPFNYYVTIISLACFFCPRLSSRVEACCKIKGPGFTFIIAKRRIIRHKATLIGRCRWCCWSCCRHYCRSCDCHNAFCSSLECCFPTGNAWFERF